MRQLFDAAFQILDNALIINGFNSQNSDIFEHSLVRYCQISTFPRYCEYQLVNEHPHFIFIKLGLGAEDLQSMVAHLNQKFGPGTACYEEKYYKEKGGVILVSIEAFHSKMLSPFIEFIQESLKEAACKNSYFQQATNKELITPRQIHSAFNTLGEPYKVNTKSPFIELSLIRAYDIYDRLAASRFGNAQRFDGFVTETEFYLGISLKSAMALVDRLNANFPNAARLLEINIVPPGKDHLKLQLIAIQNTVLISDKFIAKLKVGLEFLHKEQPTVVSELSALSLTSANTVPNKSASTTNKRRPKINRSTSEITKPHFVEPKDMKLAILHAKKIKAILESGKQSLSMEDRVTCFNAFQFLNDLKKTSHAKPNLICSIADHLSNIKNLQNYLLIYLNAQASIAPLNINEILPQGIYAFVAISLSLRAHQSLHTIRQTEHPFQQPVRRMPCVQSNVLCHLNQNSNWSMKEWLVIGTCLLFLSRYAFNESLSQFCSSLLFALLCVRMIEPVHETYHHLQNVIYGAPVDPDSVWVDATVLDDIVLEDLSPSGLLETYDEVFTEKRLFAEEGDALLAAMKPGFLNKASVTI